MKKAKTSAAALLSSLLILGLASQAIGGNEPAEAKRATSKPSNPAAGPLGEEQIAKLRSIRVAVFDFDVLKGVQMESGALTDRMNTMLAAMPKVTIVNRDQIKKVAEEHKIALSGLVDSASAVRLGKFLSAQYILVGRASKIGPAQYLVGKIVDVETTVQSTISAKASVEHGADKLVDRFGAPLAKTVRRLQQPVKAGGEAALAKLRAALKPLAGKVFLVAIEETHVGRPLRDPAGQMAAANRL